MAGGGVVGAITMNCWCAFAWLACHQLHKPNASKCTHCVHNSLCARFTTHIVAHLTLTAVAAERVQWSKRSWSVVEVSTLCGRRRKKMYTQLCCESVPHTSSCTGWLRWVGVDSVLKLKLKSRLKFKCRQCVKAPLLVKDCWKLIIAARPNTRASASSCICISIYIQYKYLQD